MPSPLSIVVVEPDPDRARSIVDGLREAQDCEILVIGETAALSRRIAERNPDVVLIDIAHPSRDVLEELALASGPLDRPVAMFVDRSDPELTRAAIEAGLSAYVVAGLRPDRLRAVIDTAVSRFALTSRMRAELDAARRALEERKVIDRAKGILMKARGIGEDEAYALLRRTAMDQKRRIADVAEALVTAAGLLG
ncbi:ANTAR domain-containing response regulator [Rhodobacter calidifons]|uniref:ANTAR domain-containing protein n=1 Tax=Rhodobacter calidifons TaxID=2715277 RepID=A0ABX0G8M7_9RHOB|nr:ANTAR domain-containing protein [Rhodobacter calidifons]NHB77627.1 ANTAR domain-containing protein [Rhodobacter calidifons]